MLFPYIIIEYIYNNNNFSSRSGLVKFSGQGLAKSPLNTLD